MGQEFKEVDLSVLKHHEAERLQSVKIMDSVRENGRSEPRHVVEALQIFVANRALFPLGAFLEDHEVQVGHVGVVRVRANHPFVEEPSARFRRSFVGGVVKANTMDF